MHGSRSWAAPGAGRNKFLLVFLRGGYDAANLLVPIAGSPPDLHDPPPGCRFAPRCPFAVARCTTEPPPLKEVAAGHEAACWRSDEAPFLRQQAMQASTWMR